MNAGRRLIVNADDFGLSPGVSRGILAAHAGGILTSASLMVRPPSAANAVARSGIFPALGIGLHIDLGEWACVAGEWVQLYEVVSLNDERAVRVEITRQLELFRSLVGRDPTHLDSHQHVHLREPVRTIASEFAHALEVPLRHVTPGVQYCGGFYGQASDGSAFPDLITVDALIGILRKLPPGTTELGCHPGYAEDLNTMYSAERAVELTALCHPRVRETIDDQQITLCSFAGARHPESAPHYGRAEEVRR